MVNLRVGKGFDCCPYFPSFGADPERKESLHHASISLQFVRPLNVRNVFAPPSLFTYI